MSDTVSILGLVGIAALGLWLDYGDPIEVPEQAPETASQSIRGVRVTSPFGMRKHPVTGQYRTHNGVDLAYAEGTPVGSTLPGDVVRTGRRGGHGLSVTVRHTDGRETVYSHLSAIKVAVGDKVAKGQTLGLSGSTGLATGPHLHLELRVNGKPVDPSGLLK